MAANHNSYLLLLKCLLEDKSIDLNCRNEIGDAPLHAAARGSNLDAIRLLLQQPQVNKLLNDREGLLAYNILISNIISSIRFICFMLLE